MQGIFCKNEFRVGNMQCFVGDILFCRDEVAEKRANSFGWKIDPNSSAALVGFRSIYQLYDVQKLMLYKFIANKMRNENFDAQGDQDADDLNTLFMV